MHYALRITSLYYLTHLQSQSNPIAKCSENYGHELIVEMKNAFFEFSKLHFRMGSPQGANGILEENVAKFTDLWYPIPAAFVVICFRLFFERYVLCMMIFSTKMVNQSHGRSEMSTYTMSTNFMSLMASKNNTQFNYLNKNCTI